MDSLFDFESDEEETMYSGGEGTRSPTNIEQFMNSSNI